MGKKPRREQLPTPPGPVRRGGLVLRLYEHSLSSALLTLFALSFVLHAWGGARAYSEEQQQHGGAPVSGPSYLTTARFWEEAFQNWQSEFFAIGVLLVLSVRLRDRGSPESKPVHAAHGRHRQMTRAEPQGATAGDTVAAPLGSAVSATPTAPTMRNRVRRIAAKAATMSRARARAGVTVAGAMHQHLPLAAASKPDRPKGAGDHPGAEVREPATAGFSGWSGGIRGIGGPAGWRTGSPRNGFGSRRRSVRGG